MCTLRNIFLLITFDIHYHYRLIVIFRQKILTQKDHTHSRIFSSIQEGWHHFIFILSLLTEVHLLNVRLHKEVVEPAELNFFFLNRSHKSRVKGHLRLKMTYLPENPGSEEDTTNHTEEVRIKQRGIGLSSVIKLLHFIFTRTRDLNKKLNTGGHQI